MKLMGLNDTAVVYTANSDGDFTVVGRAALVCRLTNKSGRMGDGDGGNERGEDSQNRRLIWEADYAMPDNAQIQVGGVRWNVIAETYAAMRGMGTAVMYRRCDVIEVR